jgi:sphingolipid delta-4 desaturase
MPAASPSLDFTRTAAPQVHLARRRAIAAAHPEVRSLVGPHASTPIAGVLVVAAQLVLAWAVADLGIGWVLLVAYLVGAVLNHALYVLIHECTHNLALRGSAANKAMGIVCDLALAIPGATVFRTYHLVHHRHLGHEVMDPDITSALEARLVGASRWRKLLWMVVFGLSQGLRPLKVPGVQVPKAWLAANLIAVLGVDALVFSGFGPHALVYLVASTLFALGLHPLGGRWLQEHYVTEPGQETYS